MSSISVRVHDTFTRGLRSLPPDRARAAVSTLKLFIESPDLPRLRYRPLKGKKDHFIINGKGGDRIILRKEDGGSYAVIDVGPHDNIYRRWDRLK